MILFVVNGLLYDLPDYLDCAFCSFVGLTGLCLGSN